MSTSAVSVVVDDSRSVGLPSVWSPSSLNDFVKCPLAYWWKYAQGWRARPTAVIAAGLLVHDVLETLLGLPPDDRTVERAREIYADAWSTLDAGLDERIDRGQIRDRAGVAVRHYFEVEDPREVEVLEDGLEHEVRAELSGVPIGGKIDRLEYGPAGVRILDYKTGGAKPQYAAAYWRQLLLYAELVTEEGLDVGDVALLYLGEPARLLTRPIPPAARLRTVSTLEQAQADRSSFDEVSTWEARPSGLCGYCPFRRACPAERAGAVPMPGSPQSHRTLEQVPELVQRAGGRDDSDLVGDPEVAP